MVGETVGFRKRERKGQVLRSGSLHVAKWSPTDGFPLLCELGVGGYPLRRRGGADARLRRVVLLSQLRNPFLQKVFADVWARVNLSLLNCPVLPHHNLQSSIQQIGSACWCQVLF